MDKELMRCSVLFDMIYHLEHQETTELNNNMLLECRRQLPEKFRKVVFLTDDEAVTRSKHGWIKRRDDGGLVPGWIEVGPNIPVTPESDTTSVEAADADEAAAINEDPMGAVVLGTVGAVPFEITVPTVEAMPQEDVTPKDLEY